MNRSPIGFFSSDGSLLIPCRATDSRRDPWTVDESVRVATPRDCKALGLGHRFSAYVAAMRAGRLLHFDDAPSCLV
jgi:hypothetical protein